MPLTKPLTNDQLCEMDDRARAFVGFKPSDPLAWEFFAKSPGDVLALVAEVRRLKDLLAHAIEICRACNGTKKIYNAMRGTTEDCIVCKGSGKKP